MSSENYNSLRKDYFTLISHLLEPPFTKDSFLGVANALEIFYAISHGSSPHALKENKNAFPFANHSSESIKQHLKNYFTNKNSISFSNNLVFTKEITLESDFLSLINKNYDFNTINLFGKRPEEQLKYLNDLISKNTKDKITNFFQSVSDFYDTVFILLTIVHFKLKWTRKFDPKNTIEQDFTKNLGEIVKVNMMNKTEFLRVYSTINYKIFEKNFEDNFSMIFIKPENEIDNFVLSVKNRKNGFRNLMEEFNENKILKNCKIGVPKFEFKNRINLIDVFKSCGVHKIFEFGGNLKKISKKVDLKVGKFLQESYIDMNEDGIEVACVTSAMVMMKCMLREPPIEEEIILDKPFLYGIVKEDMLLFFGVCMMENTK